ncbi:hypothetical protein GCM10023205_37510 [Yinghuangia aomiensis]|uniref:Beta-lactamase-related domain-containing protein n=1 Tax=Yinghuangia aomiensis TaxID=676205 RepID=A0ABP9HE66_9ACTN
MTDLGRVVHEAADALAAKHVGAVVAAMSGDRVEIRGVGAMAATGASAGQPPSGDTLFEVGSVTKVFTALTLARLAVAGVVDVEEPVADLLPAGTPIPSRDGEPIRLWHLATHTSGLPRLPKGLLKSVLVGRNREDPYADCTEDYVLGTLARTKLAARPGTRFAYSNLGAGLLGIALARRAGLPYDELVAREITVPLGLSDTSVAVPPAHAARLAAGHTKRRKPTSAWDMASLAGAGGLHATAQDLLAFVRVHLDLKAVADQAFADALRLARSRQFELATHHHVHLGWMSMQQKGSDTKRLYWHNGQTGGFVSWVGFVPKRRAGVVVLSNTARSVDRTGMGLLRRVEAL